MGIDRQMSERKKTKDALSRIQALEESIPQIIQGVNGAFGRMGAQVNHLQEVLDAIGEVVGEDAVQNALSDMRLRRAVKEAEEQKAAVDASLKNGDLKVVEVIGEKSLVVGVENDKDGKAIGAGRVQFYFTTARPEFQEKLLGKGVGTTLDLPTGGKFVAQEIYDSVEKAPVTEATEATAPVEAPAEPSPCQECPHAKDGGCGAAAPCDSEKA